MNLRRWSIGYIAAVMCASAAAAQLPATYTRQTRQSLPDSLREVIAGGRFAITIERVAHDSLDRALIEYAESLVPPKDSIEAAARGIAGTGNIIAFNAAERMPGGRWWWREWDRVLLPYALTGGAVAHYVARVRELSTIANPFTRDTATIKHSASVTYTARVERPGSDSAAYRVFLKVKFTVWCGLLCALEFTHSRIVDFDRSGRPLRIRGDGPPSFMVS